MLHFRIFSFTKNYKNRKEYYENILTDMYTVQRHRGPDDCGIYLDNHVGFSHARLSIIDLSNGHQPMLRTIGDYTWAIVYNGELYNTKELRDNLIAKGWMFETDSDTEVILIGYIEYGADFVKQLNGIFAYAISDPINNCVSIFRDRCGVKPLFYTLNKMKLFFHRK